MHSVATLLVHIDAYTHMNTNTEMSGITSTINQYTNKTIAQVFRQNPLSYFYGNYTNQNELLYQLNLNYL